MGCGARGLIAGTIVVAALAVLGAAAIVVVIWLVVLGILLAA